MLEELLVNFPIKPWNWKKLSYNPNVNKNIIEKFINKPWNWLLITNNNNIDKDFIKKYINKKWDWEYIFRYKNIDINFIEGVRQHKDIKWLLISMNENIEMKFIEKYIEKLNIWNLGFFNPNLSKEFITENLYRKIHPNIDNQYIPETYFYDTLSKSHNTSLTIDIVESNSDIINWDYYLLSDNLKDITIEFIRKNVDKDLDWYYLSVKMDIDIILDNLDLPWRILYVSKNNKLREHHILKYIDKINWDWNSFLLNGHISIDFIINNKPIEYNLDYSLIYDCLTTKFIEKNINEFYWDYDRLSNNSNLNFSIVKNNPNKSWNWNKLSKYLKINIDDVINNISFPWNWTKLSKNIYLTIGMISIDKYPNLPWNWSNLCENPNITIQFIKKYSNYNYIDYIDWNSLSKNLLKNHPMIIIREESINCIKNIWKKLIARRDLQRRKMNYLIKYKSPSKNFLGGIEYLKHKEYFENY